MSDRWDDGADRLRSGLAEIVAERAKAFAMEVFRADDPGLALRKLARRLGPDADLALPGRLIVAAIEHDPGGVIALVGRIAADLQAERQDERRPPRRVEPGRRRGVA